MDNTTTLPEYPMRFNGHNEVLKNTPMKELTGLELEMYSIIDDIDTYSDMAKDNYKLYQNLVMKRIEKFFSEKRIYSDGYRAYKIVNSMPR